MATGVAMKTLRVACAGLGVAISCSLALGALTGCTAPQVGASSASAVPAASGAATSSAASQRSDDASSSEADRFTGLTGSLDAASSSASSRSSRQGEAPRPSAAASSAKIHPSASCSDKADDPSSSYDASDDVACAGSYRDGTYYASGRGKFGAVPVTVVIEDGAIARIDVGANQETAAMLEHVCAEVVPDIIESQSTDVDTIAGATVTSDAIIDAVNQALERALQ